LGKHDGNSFGVDYSFLFNTQKTMKKKTIIIFVAILISWAVVARASNDTVPQSVTWKFPASFLKFPVAGTGVPASSAYSSLPVPGGVPQGLPVRLQIPSIGVDSFIEDAYITPQGNMEVPSGTVDVAWFALGPHPGQIGSAVIGGHFGIKNGVPFVFYNLSKLKIGDDIYIIDDEGNTITFQVSSTALFAANADATTVFTSNDGLAHLNLITCEGTWNEIAGEYPDRTVVFTKEISSGKTAAPATTLFIGTFPRILRLGNSGADVSALQTALEQKGFLTMPPTIATGYFNALTKTALSAYQISASLTADGIFGPLTRARLISDLASNSVLPYTGLTTLTTLSFPQIFMQFLESLYATPLNGLITSVLLLAIAFMIFKIIKQLRMHM
jgi:LPXTG-site transpeptidase (sortase) family protein